MRQDWFAPRFIGQDLGFEIGILNKNKDWLGESRGVRKWINILIKQI